MKLTKILSCAIVAGTMVFAASKASAVVSLYPLVRLNISGTITYSPGGTSDNGTVTKGVPLKTVSFNTQKLIDALNASPTFTSALTNQFGSASSNQVPAGSYIVWHIGTSALIITNKNGFSFNLRNNTSGNNFGSVQAGDEFLVGNFTKNDSTGAGSESDLAGVLFAFDDFNGDVIDSYGTANLHWTYGASSLGMQKTTLSVSISGGDFFSEANFNSGAPKFHASGSGTGSDFLFQNPFYLNF